MNIDSFPPIHASSKSKNGGFLIRYVPRLSITSIVRKLKHESTYPIRHSIHKPFLSKHFGKNILSGQMDTWFALLMRHLLRPFVGTYSGQGVVADIPQAKDLWVLRSVL
ncbi:hypothetical protein [Sphingobacterium shayense]|uniref:hypothetical protein n=1 Tax=Sphingobacterium shayense TaxID=626343 RepID=UPI001FE7EA9E|nr:hypothetical protein [Sphingobacterium shayense]